MNNITKLALAGVVGSALVFGTTGCSSDSCNGGTCDAKTEKAGCKGEGKCKADAKCKGEGKCKSESKCKSEGKCKADAKCKSEAK